MQADHKNEVISLLLKIETGDETAFGKLFDHYRPNIYTTALRITNDEWLAEEILQDTFVKIWIGRAGLRDIDNFDAWIYTIARNLTYNALKRSKREREQFNKIAQDSITLFYPAADYNLQEKEFQKILDQAVERLPAKQQLTYRLIKQQNLKREQVANELDVSPETVKWNLDQAMRSIRAYCMAELKGLPLIFILHFYSKYF